MNLPQGNYMNQNTFSKLESLFLAMADKTRLRLLALMAGGEVSVGFLADQLGESQPKISRHLAYLRSTGLVSTRREGKRIYYEIEKQTDESVALVLETTLKQLTAKEAGKKGREAEPDSAPVTVEVLRIERHTSADTYMNDWTPNEMEVFLL